MFSDVIVSTAFLSKNFWLGRCFPSPLAIRLNTSDNHQNDQHTRQGKSHWLNRTDGAKNALHKGCVHAQNMNALSRQNAENNNQIAPYGNPECGDLRPAVEYMHIFRRNLAFLADATHTCLDFQQSPKAGNALSA